MKIAISILASGLSSRMKGRDKIIETVHGKPLLAHLIQEAQASKADDVFVVLPQNAFPKRFEIAHQNSAKIISNPDFQQGQSAAIRHTVKALRDEYEAIIFLLGDMPAIGASHINAIIENYDPSHNLDLLRMTSASGHKGHPVLFGKRYYDALENLTGDQGAKPILEAHKDALRYVRAQDEAPIIDLDTEEDWQNWRSLTSL